MSVSVVIDPKPLIKDRGILLLFLGFVEHETKSG